MSKSSTRPAGAGIEPQAHRLYSYEEAAEWLGVTPIHVRNMVRENRIGFVKTGEHRGRRVSGQQILDYIAAHTVNPADPQAVSR